MSIRIYLFTAPVHTGKTTALMNWTEGRANVGGILAPDRDGLRRLYTLRDRRFHDFQMSEEAVRAAAHAGVINSCKFNFAAPAMDFARRVLLEDSRQPFDWIVIDEIGKLELKGEGLEPAASEVIRRFQTGEASGSLLLVVRDELLEKVAEHYGLEGYQVVRLGEGMPG